YRESISYYVINQTRFWDRLILSLGYRIESYDLKNLYANDSNRVVTNAQESFQREKSASQWSVGFVYDRELGSNLYYKHARLYRFPQFDDIVNFGIGFPPSFDPPFFPLDPEEGTLDEVGIRHWFTRNIYASATYYELDMDNEILFGSDLNGNFRNNNVRDVSHAGLELEALIRFTPRWTLQGNYTRQSIIVRSNFRPDFPGQTTEDKWLWQNPADLANLTLSYENKEWGFSALIAGHYVGSQYRTNDPFNESEPLEPAKWGDIAFSQSFFDGLGTLYFGIKNFTDRQYALLGTRSSPSPFFPPAVPLAWYPNEGRTYYMGMKSEMDFNRMRMPTTDDLTRMNRRLYGA
ncbi:MAG: TonB-dependent receptor, partial [Chlorobiales bacterium]|nr:TonB-dependent receptor [Chlorobiales bacterium]